MRSEKELKKDATSQTSLNLIVSGSRSRDYLGAVGDRWGQTPPFPGPDRYGAIRFRVGDDLLERLHSLTS